MNHNVAIFLYGLAILFLFGWYFFTDSERAKRILGSVLTVALTALCIWLAYPPHEKIQLGLDLKGGTSFLVRLVREKVEVKNPDGTTKIEERVITPAMVEQAVEVIRKRVDTLGTAEPVIAPAGPDRILVQIPGLSPDKLEMTRDQLRKVAKLEFRKVHPRSQDILQGIIPPDPNYIRMPFVEMEEGKEVSRGEIVVRKNVDLEGKAVTSAGAAFQAKGWTVDIVFDSEGAKTFGALTAEVYNDNNVPGGRGALAIILDGKVISAPGVHDGPIYGGRCEISGHFT